MFGIILGVIALGGAAVGTTIKGIENYKNRTSAINNGEKEYYDHFGNRKDIGTNETLYLDNVNGDRVLVDYKGKVYHNISQDKRNKKIIERLSNQKNEETLVYCKIEKTKYKDYLGISNDVQIYYDINLHKELIKVSFDIDFWEQNLKEKIINEWAFGIKINAYEDESGEFIRLDDICENKISIELKKEIIEYLNLKQKEYVKKYKTFATDQLSLNWR